MRPREREGKSNGRPFFTEDPRPRRRRPFPHAPRPTRWTPFLIAALVVGAMATPFLASLVPNGDAASESMRNDERPSATTVAFDAALEFERTGTSDPAQWTHTPVGTPRAIIIMTSHGGTATHHVLSCTYGGVSMSIVTSAEDTVTEPGAVRIFFLGASIPTGARAISCDLDSGTTDDIHFVSMSFTGAANTAIVTSAIDEENQANPTETLAYGGGEAQAVMIFYSGAAAPPATTACSGSSACTLSHTMDQGQFGDSTAYQTTAGTTDQVMGWTQATDDVAVAYAAFSDTIAIPEFDILVIPIVAVVLVALVARRRR